MIGDPCSLLYRDGFDPDLAATLTRRHLAAADDGELYLQYRLSESFGFDDGRLKSADFHSGGGFGLRAVSGEMTGFAHASEISAAAIDRAAETLKLLDPSKQAPASPPPRTNRAMYEGDDPLSAVPFAKKVELIQKIDAAARARDPRVAQVSVSLTGRNSWITPADLHISAVPPPASTRKPRLPSGPSSAWNDRSLIAIAV